MIKPLRLYIFLLIMSCNATAVLAQQQLVSEARRQELQQLSVVLNDAYNASHQTAMQRASGHNWFTRLQKRNGSLIVLQGVNSLGFPQYLKTYNNVISAATTQTNTVQAGGSLGLNLSGSSAVLNNKLGIWDGGWILSTHQEFAGKAIAPKDFGASIIEHATHVAGTLMAKGVYAPAKGMAPGAATLLEYDFNNDVAEMTAAASSLLLSNHSYGGLSGWNFNDDENRWEWYGLPGDTEDYTFGFYDARAQSWDKIAYNAPYYLIVEAAGNARGETGPAVGQTYWGYRSRTDQTLVNKGPRPAGISSNDSYDVLNSTANAKNVLTVAAVNPLPFGPANSQDISVGYFSSFGPTDDGRVKPDISGMGVNVLSTDNASNASYVTLSGTSMSAPNVTGSLYLLQEYYSQKNAGNFMKSATLKGLACHTAFDAGNVGPDYIFGWGLLDMKKAAQAITDNNGKSLIKEAQLNQGQTSTYNVVASGNGVLMATICWTDPQGTPSADGTLNDRTPKLVNDLDIRISDGTATYLPWVLDPTQPAALATKGDNIRDNVEQVYVPNAVPGRAYTITVSHKGTLQSGSQPYSLIATGIGGVAYCASAPASNADSRINNITLANLNNTPAAGCTSYSDYTATTVLLEQGKTYPISLTLGTCGGNFNKIAKVFIDYNSDGAFDPTTELAVTTGTISATGTFTGNITIPGNVTPGNNSLMRVVLAETSSADAVTPCGTYGKGETQDYRVQFIKTATDAGAIAISTSNPTGACAGLTNLTVRIKNYGSATISNVPVTVTITASNNAVTTFTETYTGSIEAQAEADFNMQGTFIAVAGSTYVVTAATGLANDPVTGNNAYTANIVTGTAPTPSALQAFLCAETGMYQLSGVADGGLLWYKNQNDALPITGGTPALTAQAPVNNTFYAGVNDFSGSIGPTTKSQYTDGGYNQFTPTVTVNTKVPVILESARLYVGNPGSITFNVTNGSGQIVSTTTINAVATRTTPAAGAQANDPADQGQVYKLNLLLPAAGTYGITASYDNTATLFRSNNGVTGYPYNVGGVFSILSNNATSSTNAADTAYYKNFYYFFYDLHVKSAGCASTARVPVSLTKPTITQADTLLTSSATNSNQWYEDTTAIAGATNNTFTPSHSGTYRVATTLNGGCTVFSDPFVYARKAKHPDDSEIALAVFPVPANGKLNVIFTAQRDDALTLSLVNNAGQTVYAQQQQIKAGGFSTVMDVSREITGTYVLRIKLGSKIYGRKIFIATK